MTQPLVSIIMGIYNCEDTLRYAVESILKQSYSNWELIMCDDASTDKTFEIAKQFENKYDNIKVIRNKKNLKLAFSLNKCLKISKGSLIARMDSDDISFPFRLEKQVDFLIKNIEYSVVGSSIIIYDGKNESKIRIAKEYPVVQDLIYGTTFFHPTIMMRKNVFDDLNGYYVSSRTEKGQDIDLWFRFFEKGYKGYNIQEPLLKYHETIYDYKKKRDIYSALGMVRTKMNGFKINHLPFYVYPYALKPLISALIPKRIMYYYHNKLGGK